MTNACYVVIALLHAPLFWHMKGFRSRFPGWRVWVAVPFLWLAVSVLALGSMSQREPEEEFESADEGEEETETGASSSQAPPQRMWQLQASNAKLRKHERSHLRKCMRFGPNKKDPAYQSYDPATWEPPPSRVLTLSSSSAAGSTEPPAPQAKAGKGKAKTAKGYKSSDMCSAASDEEDVILLSAKPKWSASPKGKKAGGKGGRPITHGPLAAARRKPPPPLCNRVAAEWGQQPLPCDCHEWPQWLNDHAEEWHKTRVWRLKDGDFLEETAEGSAPVAYYRPGGKNMGERHYYNGVVTSIFKLKKPYHDPERPVFAVN